MKLLLLKHLFKKPIDLDEELLPYKNILVSFTYKESCFRNIKSIVKKWCFLFTRVRTYFILNILLSSSFIKKTGVKYSVGKRETAADVWIQMLKKLILVKNPLILIPGCGSGEEIIFLKPLKPKKIIGIDIENYSEHSEKQKKRFDSFSVEFRQTDIHTFQKYNDREKFDIIESYNAFEHFADPEACLINMKKNLKKGGFIFASFGPCYTSIGGDHFSRLRGGVAHGFDHLLLDSEEYEKLIQRFTVQGLDIVDSKFIGSLLTIRNKYFSYWNYNQYIELFKSHFKIVKLLVAIDEEAIKFKVHYPDKWSNLLVKGYSEDELLCSGINVILKN